MRIKTSLTLTIILFVVACKTIPLEESIKNAIVDDVNTITAFEITDTIKMENVKKAHIQLDSARMTFQQQVDSMPAKIEATRERLTSAEAQLKNNEFPALVFGWESIIAQEKLTLTNQQLLLIEAEERLMTTQKDLEFVEQAKSSQKKGVCYYIVKATINGEEQRFMVTPKFDVLEQ